MRVPGGLAGGPAGQPGALLGVISLRRGETENCLDCLGPSSCIFPIAPEAVHQQAVGLARGDPPLHRVPPTNGPSDLGVRWLLNVAAMTLGEYPDKVPAEYLIPLDTLPLEAGRGPVRERRDRRSGSTCAGRTWPAAASSTTSPATAAPTSSPPRSTSTSGASLFVNRGDGTFEDRSEQRRARRPGLRAERRAGRLRQRRPARRPAAPRRLGEPVPAVAPAEQGGRGLRGRDGRRRPGRADRLASRPPGATSTTTAGSTCSSAASTVAAGRAITATGPAVADPRNRCRLYRNKGDGTFVDVAEKAGVQQRALRQGRRPGATTTTTAGSTSTSRTMARTNRLYHNRGDGTFNDVAPRARRRPSRRAASPAGSGTSTTTAGSTSSSPTTRATSPRSVGRRAGRCRRDRTSHPRLYRNLGDRRVPRRHARGRARPRGPAAMGVQLRRHRQRRLPRPLPRHRPA